MSADPRGSTAIHLRGKDALPLLQRISTNALVDLPSGSAPPTVFFDFRRRPPPRGGTPTMAVAPLPSGSARPTLFCDFRGRLLHRALVYLTRQRTVWLL